MGIVNTLKKIFGKKEKIEAPESFGIIKLNDVAKESGFYDEENLIIELHRYGQVKKIKYSEADVEELRTQGIPITEEEYSDDMEFIDMSFGGVEIKK